jgi:hypothetical protein
MSQLVSQFHFRPQRANTFPFIPHARRKDVKAISDEDIAKRAYGKFIARGSAHGFDREDWASAKHELITEASRN